MMNIGIAVSGTGGHIYPGISIAKFIASKENKIIFFCPNNNISQRILLDNNFNFIVIKMVGFKKRNLLSLSKIFILFFIAFFKSIFEIKKNNLDIIIGMGGYLSLPVIFAAKILLKKVIIHEQNCYPGLANKILHNFADITAIGFEESKKYFNNKKKVFFTGNPVREEFYHPIEKNIAKKYFDIDINKKVILITGGSQGANFFNKILSTYFKNSLFSIIHIVGRGDVKEVENIYKNNNIDARIYSYLNEIYYAYFASDLVISRAGASSITEIIITKKNAILIPYPYATDDHQFKNAHIVKREGIVIHNEKDFNVKNFLFDVDNLLNSQIEKNFNYREDNFYNNFFMLIKGILNENSCN